MDARSGMLPCLSPVGWTWDGKSCGEVLCSCEGTDCGRLYGSKAECEAATAGCTGARSPVSGGCAKNAGDPCTADADCRAGGCGGELCFNPAESNGRSTCECVAPTNVAGCGCVSGFCSWYR